MSKRTKAKVDRELWEVKELGPDGQPVKLGKLIGFAPSTPREKIEISFHGETFAIYVAPGQHINERKAWARFMRQRHGK